MLKKIEIEVSGDWNTNKSDELACHINITGDKDIDMLNRMYVALGHQLFSVGSVERYNINTDTEDGIEQNRVKYAEIKENLNNTRL